jgi:1-deoxy-D-xylulose-5-phosphate synthase
MTLPDRFLDQDTPRAMYETAGLDAAHIAATAMDALGIDAGHASQRMHGIAVTA